jgi:hypothetical protein
MKTGPLVLVLAGAVLAPAAAVAQPAAASPSAFAPYEGTYRLASGQHVLIARMGVVEELARPYFLDWETGRFGYLTAGEPDRFTSPASAAARPDAPVHTEIAFGRAADGTVDALTLREPGTAARRAARVALYADRAVSFVNGPVTLAATLRMPSSGGPMPGVVLIHGSGPGSRTQLSLMNSFFATRGFAVLTYDKRGCGGSGGDWRAVDLDELARDAAAGVRWLRSQPGIDASRVGVWGISQGGWVGPLAASVEPAVAFVINSSGPATSLRRQDTFMMTNTLRFQGLDAADIDRVIGALNVVYDFGRGRATAAAVDEALDRVRANPKTSPFALPPAKDLVPEALYAKQKIGDPAWFYHLNPDNDALEPYRRLRCPVLVTYGRLDYTVPVDESAARLAAVSRETAGSRVTVTTVSDSGHGYLRMQEAQPTAPVSPTTVSRAFFDTIDGWLRDHVLR